MKDNYFSICCSVFNSQNTIERAINSVVNQTYKKIELIIVDDASQDNSYDICLRYAKKYKNIKVYRNNTNQGPLITKIIAFSKARGDFCLSLDSDDYFDNNAVEIINSNIENFDLLFFGCRKIDTNNNVLFQTKFKNSIYNDNNRNCFLINVATHDYYNSLCLKCIKQEFIKETIKNEHFFNMYRSDDKYLSALLYKRIHTVKFIDKIIYNYTNNPTGITKTNQNVYFIEDHAREEMANLIYTDKSINSNEKKYYIEYQVKRFALQLRQISIQNNTYSNKCLLFNDIGKSNYFNNYIKSNINNDAYVEILLFIKQKYSILIVYSKFKEAIYHMFIFVKNILKKVTRFFVRK